MGQAEGLVKSFGNTVVLDGLDLLAKSGLIHAVLDPRWDDQERDDRTRQRRRREPPGHLPTGVKSLAAMNSGRLEGAEKGSTRVFSTLL